MYLKTFVLVLALKTIKTENVSEKIKSCEEIITKSKFILESPKYPSNYPDNTSCLYVIKGPYCATNFTLQFLDFNIEDSLGCANDYFEITEKDALCGNIQGIRRYESSKGVLEVKFVSNQNVNKRGFKILITRDECEEENDESKKNPGDLEEGSNNIQPEITNLGDIKPGVIQTNDEKPGDESLQPEITKPNNTEINGQQPNDLLPDSIQPRIPGLNPTNLPACCAQIYSKKRFFLSSKNFPSNLDTNECKFTIKHSSNNICRLRLHFKYFNVGVQNFGCPNGYLQIDGKIICGCQTGLKLISPFPGNFDTTKTFVLKTFTNTKPNSLMQGFVIEVIQDDCPKHYTPDLLQTHSNFYFYQDQNNRINWPYNNPDYNYNIEQPRVVKHVYFFEIPNFYDFNPGVLPNRPRDVEETSYLDTPELQDFTISENDAACRNWGFQDLNMLRRNDLWKTMEKCSGGSNPVMKPSCIEFDFGTGYFQSPYFPKGYGENLNICYRFKKQPGYCKLKIHMLFFDIENSFNCKKDFLLLGNNFRYCGRSLHKSLTIFDMFNKDYHEVQFITDDDVNGNGFKAIFTQLPCNGWEIPPTTPPPIIPPPRPTPMIPCSKFVVNKFFTINLIDEDGNTCDYVIFKHDQNVCRLDLEITNADLPCDNERLIINGQNFCGPLSGRKFSFDFENASIKVSYRRMVVIGREDGPKITGYQISDECSGDPPAQRILFERMQVINSTNNNNLKKLK